MMKNYQELLPSNFDPASKVWVYQSSRTFSIGEALQIEEKLEDFVKQWKSHGAPVKGFATLLFGRFIILIADESATAVGGCSTDNSVRLIKEMEQNFNVQLLDRQHLAFFIKEKIEIIPYNQFNYAIENKFIDSNTLYFNNTILTLEQLQKEWIIPVAKSWLGKKIATPDIKQ